MLAKLACFAALVLVTALIHAAATSLVLERLRSLERGHWLLRSRFTRGLAIAALVLLLSLAVGVESAVWAVFFLGVGALPTLPDALYFSLVTFTSLGYGDVTIGDEWRLLAAGEAAIGVMMFGWATAIIVAVAHRLYLRGPEGA